jgi:hypothetical protein
MMRPEWRTVEPVFNYICLSVLLVFLVASAIPIIGYVVQIAAFFAVIYFAFRGMNLFLTIGSLGSLAAAATLFGFGDVLLVMWGLVVVPGVMLGKLTATGIPPSKAFIISLLFSTGISLGLFLMEKDLIFQGIEKAKEMVIFFIQNIGDESSAGESLVADISGIFATIKRLVPSFMALSGVIQLFLGWLGLILLLRLTGQFFPALSSFIYWKMPYNYIYMIGGLIMVRLFGTQSMKIMADNGILFIGFFYAVFGFSVFEYYLKKIRISPFLRVLFYIGFVFLQLPGLILAALVGLFDSYFDFRKVRARIIG